MIPKENLKMLHSRQWRWFNLMLKVQKTDERIGIGRLLWLVYAEFCDVKNFLFIALRIYQNVKHIDKQR